MGCIVHGITKESDMTERLSLAAEKGASLIAQLVKNLPAIQGTLVRFLDQEELLQKG